MLQLHYGAAMHVERWPIVGRAQIVQSYRPGEQSTKEAPFRTLRTHGWATAGVSVVTRNERSASGRLTMFSVLNTDSARLAREGDHRGAKALAKAAAGIETSAEFLELKQALTGRSARDILLVVEGLEPHTPWPAVHELLRRLALETNAARSRSASKVKLAEVVAGRLSEEAGLVVLTAAGGGRTAVPRWLAEAAHRGNAGDCLALTTERLDAQHLVVNAMPGIETSRASTVPFSPFGRTAPVHSLTKADAKRLAGKPARLSVLVPVTIGA